MDSAPRLSGQYLCGTETLRCKVLIFDFLSVEFKSDYAHFLWWATIVPRLYGTMGLGGFSIIATYARI